MHPNYEILLSHADFARTLARRLLKDEHQAEDAVQEVWLAALKQPPTSIGAFKSWIKTVLLNRSISQHKQNQRRLERERASSQKEYEASFRRLNKMETVRKRVIRAVMNLKDPYRTAVILRYYDALPPRRIAERLNLPLETVKSHLKRARSKLRIDMDQEFGGDGKTWIMAMAPLAWNSARFAGAGVIKAGLAIVLMIGLVAGIYLIKDASEPPPNTITPSVNSSAPNPLDSKSPEQEIKKTAALVKKPLIPTSPTVQVLGRVLDPSHRPIRGVQIFERRLDQGLFMTFPTKNTIPAAYSSEGQWRDTGVKTDQYGRYAISISEIGLELKLFRFRASGYLMDIRLLKEGILTPDGAYGLGDTILKKAQFIRGRVIDPSGAPVPKCKVSGGYTNQILTNDQGEFHLEICKDFQQETSHGFPSSMKRPTDDPQKITVSATHAHLGQEKKTITFSKTNPQQVVIQFTQNKKIHLGAISGQVLLADKAPAAHKTLYAKTDNHSFKVKADENGRFRFSNLPNGEYSIFYKRMRFDINNRDEERLVKNIKTDTKGLTLFLPKFSNLILHLKDKNGQPVDQGPRVELSRFDRSGFTNFETFCPAHGPIRLAPGVFQYHSIPRGAYNTIWCKDIKGYHSIKLPGYLAPEFPGAKEVEVILKRKRGVAGKVVRSDSTPVHGAAVILSNRDDTPTIKGTMTFSSTGVRKYGSTLFQTESHIMTTDKKGCFFIGAEGLGQKTYTLLIKLRGREVFRRDSIAVMNDPDTDQITFQLPQVNNRIEGQVYDQNKQPMANALVAAWSKNNLLNLTRADETGYYRFCGMPDGEYVIDAQVLDQVFDKGMTPDHNLRISDNTPYIPLKNNQTIQKNIELKDAWTCGVEGVLSMKGPNPPEKLYIIIKEKDKPNMSMLFSSGARLKSLNIIGEKFSIQNIPPGEYEIYCYWSMGDRLSAKGYYGFEGFTLAPGEIKHLKHEFAFSSINGFVYDKETGAPLPKATLLLQPANKKQTNQTWDSYVSTDQSGAFTFPHIPHGTYHLMARHGGHGTVVQANIPIPNAKPLDVSMAPGFDLDGYLYKDNAPIPEGATVFPVYPPIHPSPNTPKAAINAQGAFTLKDLPPGDLTLRVRRFHDILGEAKIKIPTQSPVEIQLSELP